jgi:head-tail adaptor
MPQRFNPLAIDPGELRQQIQIQAQATTQDTLGGQIEVWNTFLTTRAAIYTGAAVPDIRSKQPRENSQDGQFSSEITHVMKIRWPGPDVSLLGGQRVLYRGRFFVLQNVENIQERDRVLLLYCIEINGVQ